MAHLIRASITDSKMREAIGERDLQRIVGKAVPALAGQDVRMFILQCFREGKEKMGTLFVDGAVGYYLRMEEYGKKEEAEELIRSAIGTISFYTEGSALAREKVVGLLGHPNPGVVVAVVKSLPHTSNADNFREVCKLLLHGDRNVRTSALIYAEGCIRDASFRKSGSQGHMGESEEDFLRKALVELERAYLGAKGKNSVGHTTKRLAILVAMAYNEILDSADSRRVQEEPIDEGIYYALERHLVWEIGPDALPLLFRMVSREGIEEGVERCALHTIGRIGNVEAYREKVGKYMRDYLGMEKPHSLISVASMILDSCITGQRFSSIPAPAFNPRNSAVIRRSLMPPPKVPNK